MTSGRFRAPVAAMLTWLAVFAVPVWGSSAASPRANAEPVLYTVAVTDPTTRLFTVTAEFPGPGPELLASLPAWTPGSYDLENYARNVRNFSAADGSGRPLGWEKADPDSWRVLTEGAGLARLSFDYYADSLDLDKSKIFDDFAFFNGTNLFLFEEGRTERPAELTLELPEGWRVATGLPQGEGPNRFTAGDYDELTDAPTFLGKFQLDSFTAGGKPAQLAVYPKDAFTEAQRALLRESIDRILTEQNRILGGAPYESYTTLMYIGPASFAGGLEHANSHFDILPPTVAETFEQTFPLVQSLLAHETFHLWNVKRIRPAAMWPYDYDEWQPTELLWFSEGVTDYYADLTVARAGLYTTEQFLSQIENNLATVGNQPAAVAAEDASLNTWIDPVYGDRYVYYPQGALLGLLLDVRIRSASGNQRSLDTVVRDLYVDFYEKGEGFTTADLLARLEEAGDGDVEAFFEDYVDGREPLPLQETLALAGLSVEHRETAQPLLGVAGNANAAGEVEVGLVQPGSAAADAGMQAGDVLLQVGEIEVGRDPTWAERFGDTYRERDGQPLPIRVRRNGGEQVLSGTVRVQRQTQFEVSRDADAGPAERAIFDGLVGTK